MSLYSLLGVQFFGELTHHCVKNTTNPELVLTCIISIIDIVIKTHWLYWYFIFSDITINSLAIPDTFCSPDPDSGYQCPAGMKCMKLNLSKYIMGFNGFEEFG